MRYNNYHKHTHYSSIFTPDSEAKIKDYINRAIELGHNTYFTTEHGYMGSIFEANDLCLANNIKCIAAMEGYIVPEPTQKDNSNYHIMLIPTSDKARKKLNKASSRANREGYYYKPRLFLEDLLNFKEDELYITNACVGGLLRDDISTNQIAIPLIKHFKQHFLVEVQSHNTTKQKEMNKKAIQIANEYNLRLIHANDSHYIYEGDSKWRDILLEGKGMKYEDEEGFILDYPDSDTIVKRYKKQGILNDVQIKEALESTLIFDNIVNLVIDKKIKMPNINKLLTPEQRIEKLKGIINENYQKIKIQDNITKEENKLYIQAIREEFKVIEDTISLHTMDYFLLNYPLIHLAIDKYGGVLTSTSRGSAGAYYINRLLGITQLDRIRAKIPLYYQRFMSSARLLENNSMPDCDFNLVDPEPFRKASRELLGEKGCEWMLAYGTMQESEAFRNVCRSYGLPFDEFNAVAKDLDKYRNDEKWKKYIEESQRYIGTIISASAHPCSNLLFDGDLEEELGVLKIGEFYCCPITSGEADSYTYLKNDYLQISVLGIIQKTFDLIGKPRMTLIELENALDDKVWDIYAKGLTTTVNQIDSDYAKKYSVRYKPKSVSELAMLTGAIRPNFADYREDFIMRKKCPNPVEKMDKLFASTNGYIIFQENLMQFFEWLGISPAKSISLIKKISKKKIKKEDFDALTITLKENWIKENGSEAGFDETWEKIQSMMGYGYNCVSGDTVILRPYNNGNYIPTIKEMYLIKNNRQYAKKTGHLNLHKKYRSYGFGNTFSIHEDGNLYENQIYDIVFNGTKPIYLLTLEDGKTIKCTMNHRFPTPTGNKMLSELKIGDILFVFGKKSLSRKAIPTKIRLIEYIGEEEVYDVQMDGDYHTWVANDGIVTHNSPHALAMAYDSLYCAYLKSHYPLEYFTVVFDYYKDDSERTNKLMEELKYFEITLKKPRFRYSKATYFMDKETNSIYKGVSSIKFLNESAADYLYSLKDEKFDDFVDFLCRITEDKKINTRQLKILIQLQFFQEFGKNKKLLSIYNVFEKFYGRKMIPKNKEDFEEYYELIKKYSEKETEKQYIQIDTVSLLKAIVLKIPDEDIPIREQMNFELEVLGRINLVYEDANKNDCYVLDVDTKYSPKINLYSLKTGKEIMVKVSKSTFNKNIIKKGDLIHVNKFEKKYKSVKTDEGWEKTSEIEWWLASYKELKL